MVRDFAGGGERVSLAIEWTGGLAVVLIDCWEVCDSWHCGLDNGKGWGKWENAVDLSGAEG